MITEKRAIPRFEFSNRVVNVKTNLKYNENSFHYVSYDLSCHGMCLLTNDTDHLTKGSPITATFYVDDPLKETRRGITVKGEVVSTMAFDEIRNRLGIRFTRISQANQTLISSLSHINASMSDDERMECENLKKEIRDCSANMLKIISAFTIVTLGYMGAILTQPTFDMTNIFDLTMAVSLLILTPMILLHVGSILYCSEMEKMRRNASYIREHFSQRYQNLAWEPTLFLQRRIKHSKLSNFTLGYYYFARYIGFMALILRTIKISEYLFLKPDMSSELRTFCLVALSVICLVWLAYYLPKLKNKIRRREGADSFEGECFCQWELIKKYKKGVITDFDCVKKLFNAFFHPWDFKLMTMQNLRRCKSGTKDATIKNYIKEFMRRIIHHGYWMKLRPLKMAKKIAVVLAYILIFAGIVSLINYLFTPGRIINRHILSASILSGCLMVWILRPNTILRRMYYPFSLKVEKCKWYVSCDDLRKPFSNRLNTRSGPLQFPPDSYTTEVKVSPFIWSVYYSFKRCWARKNDAGVFEQYMWEPCSKEELKSMRADHPLIVVRKIWEKLNIKMKI